MEDTKQRYIAFVHRMVDRDYYMNPSRIALTSYYFGFTGKFGELRAIAEKESKIYKQTKKA